MRSLIVASMILWLALAGSGCEKKTEVQKTDASKIDVRVVGPLKVNGRGTLLLCGTKEGSAIRYYNVRLDGADDKAKVVPIPGVGTCLGAEWRHSAESDELLWITGDEQQEFKKFEITANGISQTESIAIDPNFVVVAPSSYAWGASGKIVPLRASRVYGSLYDSSYDSSGVHLGLLRIEDGVLNESTIPAPGLMQWTDESTFYMVSSDRGSNPMMLMSKAKLNPESMAVEVSEILRAKEIRLAAQGLDGAVVYVVGTEVFAGDRRLCVLPERLSPSGPLYVSGEYLAYFSASETIYVLNRTGDVVRSRRIDEASSVFGISALTHCVYGVREDQTNVYAYDFAEDIVRTLFSVE